MNYRGQYKRDGLPVCPKCGMDSGRRMVTEGSNEQYYVVCETCGYRTKPHPNQTAATNEWSRKSKKGEK